ncbi:MAG TPA: hypothetical protein DEB05_04340 [Firmicutes bacterium]|nr:hypothetical protein [Bacillota bacterium]HBT16170.1 hypothetical protein [Bacillota bacterium]
MNLDRSISSGGYLGDNPLTHVFLEYSYRSYAEAYEQVSLYMDYYNHRRRHGSLKNMAPQRYHEAIMSNSIKPQALVA